MFLVDYYFTIYVHLCFLYFPIQSFDWKTKLVIRAYTYVITVAQKYKEK